MNEFIEKCIRMVDEMAGEGFDQCSDLMLEAYEKHEISLDRTYPLEHLIKKLKQESGK